MRRRDKQDEYATIRKALLLRRPDDIEYEKAAHLALASLSRLERQDLSLSMERTAIAWRKLMPLLAEPQP